jgi:hypothetical protein
MRGGGNHVLRDEATSPPDFSEISAGGGRRKGGAHRAFTWLGMDFAAPIIVLLIPELTVNVVFACCRRWP